LGEINNMSSPFIGEIRMFGGNFAPVGWAFCDGALMPIDQNPALFQLIGTTYGGDGQTTFALPNLQSRIPLHVGPGFALGQTGGAEQVTLTTSQIPSHPHVVQANSSPGTSNNPAGNVLANEGGTGSANVSLYNNAATTFQAISPSTIGNAGGGQPHDNMAPFLAVNFILSLFGIFPTQT
jgi:microcystin-dependent protein